jgi:hypothetical protein
MAVFLHQSAQNGPCGRRESDRSMPVSHAFMEQLQFATRRLINPTNVSNLYHQHQ